jgi:hypothetical protein
MRIKDYLLVLYFIFLCRKREKVTIKLSNNKYISKRNIHKVHKKYETQYKIVNIFWNKKIKFRFIPEYERTDFSLFKREKEYLERCKTTFVFNKLEDIFFHLKSFDRKNNLIVCFNKRNCYLETIKNIILNKIDKHNMRLRPTSFWFPLFGNKKSTEESQKGWFGLTK